MAQTVKAELIPPSMLVWGIDRRHGPRWESWSVLFEYPFDSEIGQMIVAAFQRRDYLTIGDTRYKVGRIEITITP